MWFPLAVLALLSLGGGYLMHQNHLLEHWLYPPGSLTLKLEAHPHGLPLDLLWLSLIAAFGGILLGAFFYWKGLPAREGWDEGKWHPFRRAARDQFGYDNAMVASSVQGGNDIGVAMWQGADSAVVDGAVNGAGVTASWLGGWIGKLQNGFVRQYALIMLIGVIGLLGMLGYSFAKLKAGSPTVPAPVASEAHASVLEAN
jgi:NADH-quinone oxidoreductase subunit L